MFASLPRVAERSSRRKEKGPGAIEAAQQARRPPEGSGTMVEGWVTIPEFGGRRLAGPMAMSMPMGAPREYDDVPHSRSDCQPALNRCRETCLSRAEGRAAGGDSRQSVGAPMTAVSFPGTEVKRRKRLWR
jgi:hypothetical protein